MPTGLDNLTSLFDFFLESINRKLAGADRLNYDPESRLVTRAVANLAEQMSAAGQRWLPREDAKVVLSTIHSSTSWEKSLVRHLLSEGVLSDDRFETNEGVVAGIRFSYDRFTDHQIAKLLLDKHFDAAIPAGSFSPDKPLGSMIKDESTCRENANIIGALTIQLPERFGNELPDLAPHCAAFSPVRDAMLESIIWRSPSAFSGATLRYLNQYLLSFRDTAHATLRAVVAVSTQPGHPYNAEFLHRNLMARPMPQRDAWWSTFIHHEYWEQQSPVKRLLDWAEIEGVQGSTTDESLMLIGHHSRLVLNFIEQISKRPCHQGPGSTIQQSFERTPSPPRTIPAS